MISANVKLNPKVNLFIKQIDHIPKKKKKITTMKYIQSLRYYDYTIRKVLVTISNL